MTILRSYPILGAILAQIGAVCLVLVINAILVKSVGLLVPLWANACLMAVLAMIASRVIGLAVWWLWIAALFPAAMFGVAYLGDLPSWPFGVAFILLFLFFSNTAKDRVPLYLTNEKTAEALVSLMKEREAVRFIDLGSGLGGVVRAMDGEGRQARGVETAPMVWLVSRILSAVTRRGTILRQDIWSTDLSQEDVVYAFLSPEPMPALWEKAKSEMKPGSLFVSNSFSVPGIAPDEVWELGDRRKTKLFLYRITG